MEDHMSDERSIEELRSRAPGADPENPYEDVDIEALPEWWRRAIEEFEAHDLRPYRPPRFEDGSLAHEAIAALEEEFGIDIGFGSVDTDYREEWTVRIDDEPIGIVGRHRSYEGYTVYELERARFESLVRDAIEERD